MLQKYRWLRVTAACIGLVAAIMVGYMQMSAPLRAAEALKVGRPVWMVDGVALDTSEPAVTVAIDRNLLQPR